MNKQFTLFERDRTLKISRRIPAAEVEAARTPAGGWTRAALAKWGVPWPPPKGWRTALEIPGSRAMAGLPPAGGRAKGPFYDGDAPPWETPPAQRYDPAFAEAMRDARDIREWTDGPNPASWRIYRLAQALKNG